MLLVPSTPSLIYLSLYMSLLNSNWRNVIQKLKKQNKYTASGFSDLILVPSFAERPPGYDRVRNAEIGNKDFELDVLEEAYTTEHWLVRIYKVNKLTLSL